MPAWLGRNDGKGDPRGLCIPPYFVFQFRSDGHPLPQRRALILDRQPNLGDSRCPRASTPASLRLSSAAHWSVWLRQTLMHKDRRHG